MLLTQLFRNGIRTLSIIVRSRNLPFLVAFGAQVLSAIVHHHVRDLFLRRVWNIEGDLMVSGGRLTLDFGSLGLLEGIYFDKIYDLLDDFTARPNWVVIDIGAHVGMYALRAAKLVGRGGAVIAVEPHPRNFTLLQRNVQQNNVQNVLAYNVALSDGVGMKRLFLSSSSGTHSTMPRKAPNIVIRTLTLDRLVEGLGIQVDLIKMHVEGAEMQVLDGAKRLLRRSNIRLVIPTHSHSAAMNAVDFLRSYCIRILVFSPFPWYRLAPIIYAVTR